MPVNGDRYHHVRREVIASLASDPPFAEIEQQATRYAYAEALVELGTGSAGRLPNPFHH